MEIVYLKMIKRKTQKMGINLLSCQAILTYSNAM